MNRNGLINQILTQNKGTARGKTKISAKKVIHTPYKQYRNEVDETL